MQISPLTDAENNLRFALPGSTAEPVMMNFKTLLQKHQALLAENKALREENEALKAKLGVTGPPWKPAFSRRS